MAEILTNQTDLDRVFKRIENDFGEFRRDQVDFAVKEIGRVRSEVAEMISEYSDSKGKVTRRRLNRLLEDLEDLEDVINEYGEDALNRVINDTSEWTARRLNNDVGLSLSADQFDRINGNVAKYVIDRFGEDGLVLSDRVWGLSQEIRDSLSQVIRSEILKGNSVNTIVTKIRRVYNNETWKIKRLARTESLTAHRAAISYSAEESEVVQWVRFHAGDDRSEACVAVEQRDKYGEGRGIYKPGDSEMFTPHPNCTSHMSYIIDERWL